MTTQFNENKEICFNCKHTKRFHNSVNNEGCCSQPTCQCSCFINSGLYYGMDIFDSFEEGKKEGYDQRTKEVLEVLDKFDENKFFTSEKVRELYDTDYSENELIEFVIDFIKESLGVKE